MKNLNFEWKFIYNPVGKIVFFYTKKIQFRAGWSTNFSNSFISYWYSLVEKSSDFSTFFSFLSRSYLGYYMLQFGHTKSTLEPSFKNFLIMIYNGWFIVNILTAQTSIKRYLLTITKMFYLGGSVCLTSPFNNLFDGTACLYGSYTNQLFTRYKWVNGLLTNFVKVNSSINNRFWNTYSGVRFITKWSARWLLRLWFCMKGMLNKYSLDINFLPSMRTSSWSFLESNSKFYPTISIANTASFISSIYLDYFNVSNDYSLLTLSFYVNLLLISFKKSSLLWKYEFSLYPQKLLVKLFEYQFFPIKSYIHLSKLYRNYRYAQSITKKSKYLFLENSRRFLAKIPRYFFFFWKIYLNSFRNHLLWRTKPFFKKPFKKNY